jgi:hypothetical protein
MVATNSRMSLKLIRISHIHLSHSASKPAGKPNFLVQQPKIMVHATAVAAGIQDCRRSCAIQPTLPGARRTTNVTSVTRGRSGPRSASWHGRETLERHTFVNRAFPDIGQMLLHLHTWQLSRYSFFPRVRGTVFVLHCSGRCSSTVRSSSKLTRLSRYKASSAFTKAAKTTELQSAHATPFPHRFAGATTNVKFEQTLKTPGHRFHSCEATSGFLQMITA